MFAETIKWILDKILTVAEWAGLISEEDYNKFQAIASGENPAIAATSTDNITESKQKESENLGLLLKENSGEDRPIITQINMDGTKVAQGISKATNRESARTFTPS